MHLKSITLKGFKSFPEKTKLRFSPGVSVIVGPNGSGKSNITDAVLWALGEQSPVAVRGSSMQDVISAGGEGIGRRRAAEVQVEIDNPDARGNGGLSEIAIERRLERSGEGGYRLNGARCRLVDIVEILSDANLGREMHSVISQGRVEAIVHSKPRERRLLIEEAAGLGKHRKRRRRAELKLERARENLDRALDVEREARSRLRPLKRQAQAAELGRRIEQEQNELRARLLGEELRRMGELEEAAAARAEKARHERRAIESRLAKVSAERREAEERFAARDRERTRAWGHLTQLRAAKERLAIAHAELSRRQVQLADRVERLRGELAPLRLDLEPGQRPIERGAPLTELFAEIDEQLALAAQSLDAARGDRGERTRAASLRQLRASAERVARGARAAESLLGEQAREELRQALSELEEVLSCAGLAAASLERIAASASERTDATEGRITGEDSDGDAIAEEMRACSKREYELQGELKVAADALTEAEVEAAQIRDRRAEAGRELAGIAEALDEQPQPSAEPLPDEEREQIERRIEALERRRAQIGPFNPLAGREYEEAASHVAELEGQRQDTEGALAELGALIGDIDREIERAFEETFEATAHNFSEMIGHLIPGGRGVLRRVTLHSVRQEPPEDERAEEDEEGQGREQLGVEIEVTPEGKATRRLSLLSGGEKSLVALAFVFAVFLARPCPFYILDEVEAALDDANIDRFLQLVRRFSDRAQFIIVTHQKRTMDAADVLYGVSMGKDGVSRVLSRRLAREEGDAAGEPQAEDARAAAA